MSPMPSSKIFYDFPFWSYRRLNQRSKKSCKKFLFQYQFLQLFFTSLIQTLITSKQKIVEEFQRWHWTRHEKISKTLLKRKKMFFFISCSLSSFSQYAVCIIFSFPMVNNLFVNQFGFFCQFFFGTSLI